MSSRIVTVVLTVMIYYMPTLKNLLRVSTRVPVHCLMHRHAQGRKTLSGNRSWRFVNMCRRIMTLVFTVMLHILTVRNCTESATDVPVHCLMHRRTLYRAERVYGVAIGGTRDRRRRIRGTHAGVHPAATDPGFDGDRDSFSCYQCVVLQVRWDEQQDRDSGPHWHALVY